MFWFWLKNRRLPREFGLAVSGRRQSGDANAAVALVADVQANQQSSDLLDDARIFQLSSINRADAGNLGREFASELCGVGIVAADDNVTIKRVVAAQQIRRKVMKSRYNTYFVWNQFRGLLRGGPLPDPECTRSSSAHARCQRNSSVDQNAARCHRRLQSFE